MKEKESLKWVLLSLDQTWARMNFRFVQLRILQYKVFVHLRILQCAIFSLRVELIYMLRRDTRCGTSMLQRKRVPVYQPHVCP